MQISVFESGSGKWIFLKNSMTIGYTSDASRAAKFTPSGLLEAKSWFEDFVIYKKTLHAVVEGSNSFPSDSPLVNQWLLDYKDQIFESY